MREQVELVRDGREVGQLIAARVQIRPEAGQRDFLGQGHAADRVVLLQHQDAQARARQIAGAGQSVVACSEDDRVIGLCHVRSASCP
jgi:hypothetical protein